MILLLVTLISVLLAAAMTIVAWRSSREERRRSAARIAALAAEIHDEPALDQSPSIGDDLFANRPPIGGDLFSTRQPARGGFRFATVAAGGLLVCGGAVALAVVSSNASSGSSTAADRPKQVEATSDRRVDGSNPQAAMPIELVALGHEREGDRLIVRGVVRNPASGAELDRVTAVVLLFKEDGGFLGSGRAKVESPALGPGGETTFAVTVPGAGSVGRYRVSFRSEDRVVPHIDRRGRT
jgi:hypothetical protein